MKDKIRQIREGKLELNQEAWMSFTEGIGPDLRVVKATGRSTCRFCGKKIKKGERALVFCHDFNGSGSWTAVDCYVHFDRCPGDQ